LLRLGGVIVEGHGRNTGIGARWSAMRALSHRHCQCPETPSQEKKDMLLCAASICVSVPAVPYATQTIMSAIPDGSPRNRRAESNGAIWAPVRQLGKLARPLQTTAPENLGETAGKVDGFTCSVGNGARFPGWGSRSRSVIPTSNHLSDCMGSGNLQLVRAREFKPRGNRSPKGIGNNRETKNLEGSHADGQYQITDAEMLPILYSLVQDEGLVLGGSTGINVVRRRGTCVCARIGADSCISPIRALDQLASSAAHPHIDPGRAARTSPSSWTRLYRIGSISASVIWYWPSGVNLQVLGFRVLPMLR